MGKLLTQPVKTAMLRASTVLRPPTGPRTAGCRQLTASKDCIYRILSCQEEIFDAPRRTKRRAPLRESPTGRRPKTGNPSRTSTGSAFFLHFCAAFRMGPAAAPAAFAHRRSPRQAGFEVPGRFPADGPEAWHPAGWGSSDRRVKWLDFKVSKVIAIRSRAFSIPLTSRHRRRPGQLGLPSTRPLPLTRRGAHGA